MKILLAALAVGSLSTLAPADEVQTFPGPDPVYWQFNEHANPSYLATFTGAGYAPAVLRLTMDMTAVAPGTEAGDIFVTCTPPGGEAFDVQMSTVGEYSVLAGVTVAIPLARSTEPKGPWTFTVYEVIQQGDGQTPESTVSNFSVALESGAPPQFAQSIGTLPVGLTELPNQPLTGSALLWYTFDLPLPVDDVASPRYLDISTTGGLPLAAGVYDNDGVFRGQDHDSGPGNNFFLSYGYGGGPTTGEFTISDGRTGKLQAGAYWLVVGMVSEGTLPFFRRGWQVSPAFGSDSGNFTLKLDLGVTPIGGTPPAANDLGGLTPGAGGAENLVTADAFVPAGGVAWLKFFVPPVTAASGMYLDISTGNVTPGDPEAGFDPQIALYAAGGFPVGVDDDDGPDSAAFLSFGGGGGTTTGDTVDPGEQIVNRSDGRDGDLPAGFYYLAVKQYRAGFGPAFNVTSFFGGSSGAVEMNFRIGAVTTLCSAADLGVQGGTPGHDGLLNNNDFIVFINFFFASDPAADLGVQGGTPGQDGLFNNNDFVVFINLFFSDQANCTG